MPKPELRKYQINAINTVKKKFAEGLRRFVLQSPTGCHRIGQGILMFDGSVKRVEDVVAGDLLMGPDSLPREVMELRRGHQEMVEIKPTKGDPFAVNIDHVLSLRRTNDGSKHAGSIVDVTVREWLRWNGTMQHVHKLFRVGVEFPPKTESLPLDPYFLGLLLSDGCLINGVAVTKPDSEVKEECERQAKLHGLRVRSSDKQMMTHHLVMKHGGIRNQNPITMKLQAMGLHGKDSWTKFVPSIYKLSSRENRLAVLAGILDGDGHLTRGGYDYVSASETLAKDVAFLARSIGLAAYASSCVKSCQTGVSNTYWRVSISGDCSALPMRLPRKKSPPRKQKKDVLCTGFSASILPPEDYYGFTLSGDGRYLLDDFTVTHNSGKTLIGAEIMVGAVEKNKRVLFLAHRRELITQAYNKLIEMGVPKNEIVNLREKGSLRRAVNPHIFVGSIQLKNLPVDVDVLIIDEAHRSAAKTYQRIISDNPNAVLLGLSATPERLDGKPLDMYEEIVVVAQPPQLVKEGFILKPRVFTVPPEFLPDTNGIGSRNGDFDPDELEEAVTKQKIIGHIVEHWMKRGKGLQTICFAKSRKHSKLIVEEFVRAGVKAVHVDATTPAKERDTALEALRNCEIEVLSNADLFIEGIDITIAKCCILARPTESVTIYLQSVGRVLRPYEDLIAIVLDHAGNARRHGLPTSEREFDLSGRIAFDKCGIKTPGVRTCPSCLMECESDAEQCDDCGYKFPKKVRSDIPESEDGFLVEMEDNDGYTVKEDKKLDVPPNERAKRSFWIQTWRTAWDNGHTAHEIHKKYQKRFGEPVPNHFTIPERPPVTSTQEQKRKDLMVWKSIADRRSLSDNWVRERFTMKHGITLNPGMTLMNAFHKQVVEVNLAEKRAAMEAAKEIKKTDDVVVDLPDQNVVQLEFETGEL